MFEKIKIKKIESRICLKVKLDKNEIINNQDLDIFNSAIMRGLPSPQIESKSRILYSFPSCDSVQEFLSKGLSQFDLFLLIAQFSEILKSIRINHLNQNNLIYDIKYSFVDKNSKELMMIYKPIIDGKAQANVKEYLSNIIKNCKFSINEDLIIINRFLSLLNSSDNITFDLIDTFIMDNFPEIYGYVVRQEISVENSDDTVVLSGFTAVENKEVQFEEQFTNENYSGIEDLGKTEYFDDEIGLTECFDGEEAQSFGEFDLRAIHSDYASIEDEYQGSNEDCFDISFGADDTVVLNNAGQTENPINAVSGDTVVLNTNQTIIPHKKAHLIIQSLGAAVEIVGKTFTIGSGEGYCEYVISNPSVSRMHLTITYDGNDYYATDNGSTNGTLINGVMLKPGVAVKLQDLDRLMIANELIDFQISEDN